VYQSNFDRKVEMHTPPCCGDKVDDPTMIRTTKMPSSRRNGRQHPTIDRLEGWGYSDRREFVWLDDAIRQQPARIVERGIA